MKNPVAKHLNIFNKPSVVPCKAKALRSNATLRDALSDAQIDFIDSQTITFEGGSTVCWDESGDSLQGCLNDVGCSSVSIDAFEDNCEEDK